MKTLNKKLMFVIILSIMLTMFFTKYDLFIFPIFILFMTLLHLNNEYIQSIGSHKNKDISLMQIYESAYHNKGDYYEFKLINESLLTHKDGLESLYYTLLDNERFRKFGVNKIIIVTAFFNNMERSIHRNVILTNDMKFEYYYDKIKDYITKHYEEGYYIDVNNEYVVKVWNMDKFKGKKITINEDKDIIISNKIDIKKVKIRNIPLPISIKPTRLTHRRNFHSSSIKLESRYIEQLKINKVNLNNFATMDIETININSNQIPIAITSYNGVDSKIFLIDHILMLTNSTKALSNLFKEYFDYIYNSNTNLTIFVHNLGSFDEYFIYKELLLYIKDINDIESIIDKQNEFIQITINKINTKGKPIKINFKNSYRIFPVSLDSLCNNFWVIGKISKYNPLFNDYSLFNNSQLFNEFKEYSIQDSISLYNALFKGQELYFNNYNIDITDVFSTSTLSLKIFRKQFTLLTSSFLTFIPIDSYRRMIKSYQLAKVKQKLEEQKDEVLKLTEGKKDIELKIADNLNYFQKQMEVLKINGSESEQAIRKSLDSISELENSKTQPGATIDEINKNISYHNKNIIDEAEKMVNKFNDVYLKIKEFSKNKDEFVYGFIDDFKNYISTLNTIEISALSHIMCNIVIIICILNIFTILLGNKIIDLLKLEIKFPKIAKYLKYRSQMQTFNLFINFSILFFFLFFIIYTDICVLLKI